MHLEKLTEYEVMFEDVVLVYLEMMQSLLSQPSYNFSEASANDVPASSGVYVIQTRQRTS